MLFHHRSLELYVQTNGSVDLNLKSQVREQTKKKSTYYRKKFKLPFGDEVYLLYLRKILTYIKSNKV